MIHFKGSILIPIYGGNFMDFTMTVSLTLAKIIFYSPGNISIYCPSPCFLKGFFNLKFIF